MAKPSNLIVIFVVGLTAALASGANAGKFSEDRSESSEHRGEQACSKHAQLMRRACFADRKDDYLVLPTLEQTGPRRPKNAATYLKPGMNCANSSARRAMTSISIQPTSFTRTRSATVLHQTRTGP